MAEFKNVKIIGIKGDIEKSATGTYTSGSEYTNLNILDLDSFVTAITAGWTGGIVSSMTTISAASNWTGVASSTISAYAFGKGGTASTSSNPLTAAAFLTIKDEFGGAYKIPLFR
jgi:hypothetical protein